MISPSPPQAAPHWAAAGGDVDPAPAEPEAPPTRSGIQAERREQRGGPVALNCERNRQGDARRRRNRARVGGRAKRREREAGGAYRVLACWMSASSTLMESLYAFRILLHLRRRRPSHPSAARPPAKPPAAPPRRAEEISRAWPRWWCRGLPRGSRSRSGGRGLGRRALGLGWGGWRGGVVG